MSAISIRSLADGILAGKSAKKSLLARQIYAYMLEFSTSKPRGSPAHVCRSGPDSTFQPSPRPPALVPRSGPSGVPTGMNLYFRLLIVLLRNLFPKRRLKPFEVSVLHSRVWPTDLDVNLHMNNGLYLGLMDLGRFDLMQRVGLVHKSLAERWMPVVVDVKIRYRQSLKPFEAFELHTRLVGWDRKFFYLEQRFTHGNRVMARALVRAAIVGKKGRTLHCDEVMEAFGVDLASPPVDDEFQIGWVSRPGTQPLPPLEMV